MMPLDAHPRVLPGSLITLRRRCGKRGCRCATGPPHETPALSYSEGGRTRMLTLRPEEVPAVREATARYRGAVRALEAEARAALAAFRSAVMARRGAGDRAGRGEPPAPAPAATPPAARRRRGSR